MTKTAAQVRRAFLEYFKSQGHEIVASGSLIPANDPTLMFANAGMVQFKDVFTGREKRPYRRATTSQKCIRISGKHNDLENVGVTARHHTFFEMLGNFSFGDYFKEESIYFGWELITKVLGIPRDRLLVTYFGGEGSLPADEEARSIWKKLTGFGDERVRPFGAKDNFWSMGDTGPCGPCSEIFYYFGDAPDPSKMGDEPTPDGKGWVELWNHVFMQFERSADGKLDKLPAPSIDTGAGLERLSCVTQGVSSNYDTDLLRPIVDFASSISKKKYGGTLAPDDVSMRVIADHARTTAFLIAEGVFPDRDGRPYVLRRVMRRAIRHGHRLGIRELFMHRAALEVVDLMGEQYPELVERKALIEDIAKQEEERFRKTLDRGLELLAENKEWGKAPGGQKILPGNVAFKLYDTYGFPIDLQEVIGNEQAFSVDQAGFEREMEAARERSQGSKVGEKAVERIYQKLAEELGKTTFLGYEREHGESTVFALLEDGARVSELGEGREGEVVTKETPFYAESGGQVGDRGRITTPSGTIFEVTDTLKPVDGFWVHKGKVSKGALRVGDKVELDVDTELRAATRRNHSATHLLHFALRSVVGEQAMQKGSLVGPERLRFDYAGTKPLTSEEIARIEDLVNERVLQNYEVTTHVLPMDEAKARGAIGIFEEKYGAEVRMLTISPDSIELCGGTHVRRTGDIGLFKIVSESGLAAGVRRIEATTGLNALAHLRRLESELESAGEKLKSAPLKVSEAVERALGQQRQLRRELDQLKQQILSGGSSDLTTKAKDMGGFRVLGAVVDLPDQDAMRQLADQLKDKLQPAVIVLGAKAQKGKVSLVCAVSKELTKRFPAGNIVKACAALVGGGGGGRPDFAQAGGTDPDKLDAAVAHVYALAAD